MKDPAQSLIKLPAPFAARLVGARTRDPLIAGLQGGISVSDPVVIPEIVDGRNNCAQPVHSIKNIDARFSSCAYGDGILTMNFEGGRSIDISIQRGGEIDIKLHLAESEAKSIATPYPIDMLEEICGGREIMSIAITRSASSVKTKLSIFFTKDLEVLTLTSDSPISFCD